MTDRMLTIGGNIATVASLIALACALPPEAAIVAIMWGAVVLVLWACPPASPTAIEVPSGHDRPPQSIILPTSAESLSSTSSPESLQHERRTRAVFRTFRWVLFTIVLGVWIVFYSTHMLWRNLPSLVQWEFDEYSHQSERKPMKMRVQSADPGVEIPAGGLYVASLDHAKETLSACDITEFFMTGRGPLKALTKVTIALWALPCVLLLFLYGGAFLWTAIARK